MVSDFLLLNYNFENSITIKAHIKKTLSLMVHVINPSSFLSHATVLVVRLLQVTL